MPQQNNLVPLSDAEVNKRILSVGMILLVGLLGLAITAAVIWSDSPRSESARLLAAFVFLGFSVVSVSSAFVLIVFAAREYILKSLTRPDPTAITRG